MTEQIQQVRTVTNDGMATKTTRVIDDDMAASAQTVPVERSNIAVRIIWFIAGVLLTLLAFRFALVLLGANPSNGFANFIYSASHPFVAPFFGLFGYSLHYGVSRLELSTLVAMAVYALVAFGLSRLFTIREPRTVATR
jgi:uncharacterized protein YggT (Ycf19 family)